MTQKVNGSIKQGFWYSRDVRFLKIEIADDAAAVTATDFVTDATTEVVNSRLEGIVELASARGTVMGITVESATVVHMVVDVNSAYGEAGIADELKAAIELDADIATATVTEFEGFEGRAYA